MSFHKLDKVRDKNLWSVRVSSDIRLIAHKTASSLVLCYVDHHDPAYRWAQRRKLETHPKTGAAQLVEIWEWVEEIIVPRYVQAAQPALARPVLFADMPKEQLLAHGVLVKRLDDVRKVMVTPGGFRMSVAMTNCGEFGWVTDRTRYRYDAEDPESSDRWPQMPEPFSRLAKDATAHAGFNDLVPDSCLINPYEPGTRLSLHQDRSERDFGEPIVSVSLGIPAVFLFGGLKRADKPSRVRLTRGDLMVWGGPASLSRRHAAQGGASSASGRPSHQSHFAQGGVERRTRFMWGRIHSAAGAGM